jgi:hypothetical protein
MTSRFRGAWPLLLTLAACTAESPSQSTGGAGGTAAGSSGNPGQAGSNASGGGSSGASSSGAGGGGSSTGGTSSQAGSGTAGSDNSKAGAGAGCDSPGLTWKSARKTWYTSYPDPGSEECIKYSGCEYAGQFAACNDTKPESWVEAHNIVAAFPNFDALELHDLCLKSGDKTIVVTVLDTCGDADCDGCCTQNQGDNDALIDLESYTNARWGVDDGVIQWADLGPTSGSGCD